MQASVLCMSFAVRILTLREHSWVFSTPSLLLSLYNWPSKSMFSFEAFPRMTLFDPTGPAVCTVRLIHHDFSSQSPLHLQGERPLSRHGCRVLWPHQPLAVLRLQRPQSVRVGYSRSPEGGQGVFGSVPLGLRLERGGEHMLLMSMKVCDLNNIITPVVDADWSNIPAVLYRCIQSWINIAMTQNTASVFITAQHE